MYHPFIDHEIIPEFNLSQFYMSDNFEQYKILGRKDIASQFSQDGGGIEKISMDASVILIDKNIAHADLYKDKKIIGDAIIDGEKYYLVKYDKDDIINLIDKIYYRLENGWKQFDDFDAIIKWNKDNGNPLNMAEQKCEVDIFEYVITDLPNGTQMCYYKKNGTNMTCAEFIKKLRYSEDFRDTVNNSIIDVKLNLNKFMYIGCGINKETMSKDIYFFITECEKRLTIEDPGTPAFNNKLVELCDPQNSTDSIMFISITNPNLYMIVPCFDGKTSASDTKFTYLQNYISRASIESKNKFWIKVAEQTS